MSCRRPDGDGICPESDDARRRQNERPDYNNKTVSANGFALPALGQGACFIGERADTAQAEKAALLRGLSLGMSHIDTAEMYGGGGSERLIGEALRRNRVPRAEVVLTSKVCPWNAAPPALFASCDASLRRLGTDYLDLYLLHWRGEIALAETVAGMEELVRRGRIRRWGVSNFDVADMEELWRLPDGRNCAADQVLYHLGSRGIEFDLLPWLRARGVAAIAYCPLAQGGRLRRMKEDFLTDEALNAVARKYGASVFQIMLAFTLREGGVAAIPKAASAAHVEENARAAELACAVTREDWAELDRVFWPPTAKMHLDMD